MAYFNHAFQKAFVASDVVDGVASVDLTPGELGVMQADGLTIAAGAISATGGQYFLVQGSLHTSDTIGNNPGHGGYTETVKSKGINPKYINRIWHQCCEDLTCAVTTLTASSECFPCGQDALVRVDVKGSPALRYLNHNAYHIADLAGYCCPESVTQLYIDPTYVLAQWLLSLEDSAIVNPFLQFGLEKSTDGGKTWVAVADPAAYVAIDPSTLAATDMGRLTLTGCYVDTKFGDCSFDTRDHYNKEPVQIVASVIDETGDPCTAECVVIANTPGTMANTSGETVLRQILMTENYMQMPYNQGNADSARIREIEGSSDVLDFIAAQAASGGGRAGLYDVHYLLHSVPRFNNPTGVFDNDQYLYCIAVPCDDTKTLGEVVTLMAAFATAAGLTVEEYCGSASSSS